MSHEKFPTTPAIRFLNEKQISFTPFIYTFDGGGTASSAEALKFPEHKIIKTLVFSDESGSLRIVLQHGDKEVSTKNLARLCNLKELKPATEAQAQKKTGYLFGGTSPFGLRFQLPIYIEKSILDLDEILINGGKRGFLVKIKPEVLHVLSPILIEVAI